MAKPNNRTSPLRREPDRQPGSSLVKEMIQCFVPMMLALMGLGFAAGTLFGFTVTPVLIRLGTPSIALWIAGIAIAIIAIIALRICYRNAAKRIDLLAMGRDGELALSDALQPLRALGYEILHDLPYDPRREDSPNIDHLVIGPAGLFVIETKYRTKHDDNERIIVDGDELRIGDRATDTDAIGQTIGNAKRIAEILREVTGRPRIKTQPILVFVGRWYIEDRRPKAERHVWICNDDTIVKWIRKEPPVLTTEDIALYATRLREYAAPRERER